MRNEPLSKGIIEEKALGVGTVDDEMVESRAVQLALINGRLAEHVSEADREQARRELTGEPDRDPQDASLDAIPQSDRWDPVQNNSGQPAPKTDEDSDDEEGHSIGEQLINEGIGEAEHDQMLEAARVAEKENPTEKTER